MALAQASLMEDPLKLISTVLILIALVLFLVVSYRLWKSYQEKGKDQSKYMAFFFFWAALGIISLIIEQGILITQGDPTVTVTEAFSILDFLTGAQITIYHYAYLFAVSAYLTTSISIVYIDLFSLSFRKQTKYIPIFIVLMALYFIILTIMPFHYVNDLGDWAPEKVDPNVPLITTAILSVPLFFSPLFMLYVAYKLKEQTFQFRRAIWLAIGQFIISFAYLFEIINVGGGLALIVRFGIMIYPLWMYLGLTLPPWFRSLLGGE